VIDARVEAQHHAHMKGGEHRPQRHHQRFPCSLEVRGSKPASLRADPEGAKSPVRGRIQNLSQGGVCLLSNRSAPVSSLVRCEFAVSGTRATIPTLMQVRWAQRTPTSGEYKMGLQFLL
jgi:c-di-GMP-binding flagellar brake protein YcgR